MQYTLEEALNETRNGYTGRQLRPSLTVSKDGGNGYIKCEFTPLLTVSKLSELQKQILCGLSEYRYARPTFALRYFGFKPGYQDASRTHAFPSDVEAMLPNGDFLFYSHDKGKSANPRYKPAMAAISRAVTRLMARGFIARSLVWHGATKKTGNARIWLTEAGVKVADQLKRNGYIDCKFAQSLTVKKEGAT